MRSGREFIGFVSMLDSQPLVPCNVQILGPLIVTSRVVVHMLPRNYREGQLHFEGENIPICAVQCGLESSRPVRVPNPRKDYQLM
jgi:hypothetical protein